MSRVQLALNVSDLEASVAFYSQLFGVEPHKRRPGYANFAIAEPPLKLVLIENAERVHGAEGALNHLGIEVETVDEVEAARDRIRDAGLASFDETDTTCCYARQDKVWVHDPAGAPWEVYAITDDNPELGEGDAMPLAAVESPNAEAPCCTPSAPVETRPAVRVYEPALCCSTGVCGDDLDQRLVDFTADLAALKGVGADIERYNLATEPGAFAESSVVRAFLQDEGSEGLPLTLVDGVEVARGRYLSRADLAELAGVPVPQQLDVASDACCATEPSGCC